MADFYSNWYKQTVNSSSDGSISTGTSTISLLTPAQVTVSSVRDKLVYNIEYKESSDKIDNKPPSRTPERRSREKSFSASSNTFAAANVVAARFQNHARNHSRRHTRKSSSESDSSNFSNFSIMTNISEDSMWDDWLVKFHKTNVAVDDAKMEDWIFETTM